MNQSQFSLADLISVLGALVFGYICFLSINLLSYGNLTLNISLAVSFFLVLGGLAFWVKWIKRTNYPSKAKRIIEWILLLIFVIAAVISFRPYAHYFELYNDKDAIISEVISNIEQAENMFDDYESYSDNRLELYENRLKSVVQAKNVNPNDYASFGFVYDTDDDTQIENKMFTLKTELYPNNYQELKDNDSIWLISSKDKIEEWKSIGIVTVLKTLEAKLNDSKRTLVQFSTFKASGELADDFAFSITLKDVSDKIQTLEKPKTLLSFTSAIGLYLLMLFSYFITKRSTRDPGIKVLFGGNKSDKRL